MVFGFLSSFIYFSILIWNDKDFPHFVFLWFYILITIVNIIFVIIMYIKYIFEIKVEFRVAVFKKQLLPLEIINNGVLRKGTMLRPVRRGDDKIE
ncbi:hypothetical protein C6B38_02550 [Spiroplasma sp. ChiS]|nr:hypothetical protein C6B38_02550 [Spiroplasma sp. ChiS]